MVLARCVDTQSCIWEERRWYWKLWCWCNFNIWIGAQIEWKSIRPHDNIKPPAPVPQTVISNNNSNTPVVLGTLELEITLTKRKPTAEWAQKMLTSTCLNEGSLIDAAFLPKSYTVRVERGNFLEPALSHSPRSITNGWSRYAYRLIFKKSPYPERPEWRNPGQGPDNGPKYSFWHLKEFVGRASPELKNSGRAMNDETGWGSCVVS